MARAYIIYNCKAGYDTNEEKIKSLTTSLTDEVSFFNISDIKDYASFFSALNEDDYIVICGGDGTINCFVNDTADIKITNEILYYPCGTGNDFATDLGHKKYDEPFSISNYIKDLPTVTVNGKVYRFINGIGYGIDGYCCEVGDIIKMQGEKKVNYTSIAIKGLLFHYKPTNAKILVDGVSYTFKNVWLAPTMNGRYYGGGMMPTPAQDRNDPEQKLSTLVFHGTGKLKTLMIFPSLFKVDHIKYTKYAKVLTGKEIKVEFDRPVALQIDGETILGVTSYTASSKAKIASLS